MVKRTVGDDEVDVRDAVVDVREGPRLLIVDDEPDVHQWLGAALRFEGWSVAGAANGAEGVAMAVEWDPAVVVLDQRMPDFSGIECARRIRASAPERQIVMFSAWMDAKDQAEADELGLRTISKIDHFALLRYLDALRATFVGS